MHFLKLFMRTITVLALFVPIAVQAQQTRQAQSLDPAVAKDLLVAYEKMEANKHREALADINRLVERRGDSLKPFDRASVMQIRGTVYVNLENYAAALRDFEEVLRINALPPEQNLQMRFNVAQLYFLSEKYADAIRNFNEWIKQAENPSANAYSMLAAAYYYTKDYRNARGAIEQAIRRSTEPERRYYDLANAIYSELNLSRERTLLLERMITLWSKEQSYWRQLAALYVEQNRQQDSFVTLETAYLNGLIDSESDLVSLAQFYSLFNNPHRGAKLLEKEMAAKRVERNVKNLELLSQLWSQAREHKKAIPILQEAARISDTGLLSFRLGQALLADEQHAEAQKAFEAAVRKGGLTGTTEQEAWLLLGTARFNQAGPGDRDRRRSADEAFTQAERFAGTRNRASEWRRYIKAIDDTESRQAALEREQAERLEVAAQERLKTACRAQQLARADLSDECKALLEEEERAE
jgi:tetratricopeptide (TPR) repeat protein